MNSTSNSKPNQSSLNDSKNPSNSSHKNTWLIMLLTALGAGSLQAFSLAWPADGQALGALQLFALATLFGLLKGCQNAKQGFLFSWVFSFAWLATAIWWLFTSLSVYGGLNAFLAVLAVALLCGALALIYAFVLMVYVSFRLKARVHWVFDAIVFASFVLLAELIRGYLFTGFPWGAMGYSHVNGIAQWIAPWLGVYGVSWVAAVLAVWLYQVAVQLFLSPNQFTLKLILPEEASKTTSAPTQTKPPFKQRLARKTIIWGFVVIWIGLAFIPAPVWKASSESLSVSLLQGNIAQDEKFELGKGVWDALDWYGSQLREASGDLVIAPETAIPVFPHQLPPDYLKVTQARFTAADSRQAALVGLPVGSNESDYANAMQAWTSNTTEIYTYKKHHLVPFGEFIPPFFRWFTNLLNIPLGDFQRGDLAQASFSWMNQRIAPTICYENLFGEELAVRFLNPQTAPTIFVNASNLAWFGDGVATDQHLSISRMRTLEFARPLVSVTNTGATAIINHQGRILERLPYKERAVLQAKVEGRGLNAQGDGFGITPFAWWASRFQMLPLWIFSLLVVSAFGILAMRSKKIS